MARIPESAVGSPIDDNSLDDQPADHPVGEPAGLSLGSFDVDNRLKPITHGRESVPRARDGRQQ